MAKTIHPEKHSSDSQLDKDPGANEISTVAAVDGSHEDGRPCTRDAIDPRAARRLLWKLDLRIYPILWVLFGLSFLDRINISNARIQGLNEDLNLYGNRYNIALFVFFIPHTLLEIPSNLIIKRVRPSLYFSTLMFGWGIVNMSMGFIKTYPQLVVLRVLLGALESGVIPGVIYMTSMYYRRHQLQFRTSLFFSSVIFASAFGGLLAYAIAELDGYYNIRAWRWIFIIEGAATAFIALIAVFIIADWPEQARFLSTEEKALLKRILAEDGLEQFRMDTLNKHACKLIFRDWKIWVGSLMFLGVGVTNYSLVFFMPTILVEFGWKARQAQVHSIPVYLTAAVAMVSMSWLSDRCRHRYGFIILGCVIATAGYGILLGQDGLSREIKYGALFFACIGGAISTPMAITWLANNIAGHYKRAIGSAIQITIGGFVGLVASNIFVDREAPRYWTGYGTSLGFTWLGGISATVMLIGLVLENRKREAGGRDYRLSRPTEEVQNMGDDHPAFRFTL
ncbi:MFS general substrate transporter [Xylaria venustula]|nr:MFS general substrate transporter [Xylaria venustula]